MYQEPRDKLESCVLKWKKMGTTGIGEKLSKVSNMCYEKYFIQNIFEFKKHNAISDESIENNSLWTRGFK